VLSEEDVLAHVQAIEMGDGWRWQIMIGLNQFE